VGPRLHRRTHPSTCYSLFARCRGHIPGAHGGRACPMLIREDFPVDFGLRLMRALPGGRSWQTSLGTSAIAIAIGAQRASRGIGTSSFRNVSEEDE
jgi:hypothetical protein